MHKINKKMLRSFYHGPSLIKNIFSKKCSCLSLFFSFFFISCSDQNVTTYKLDKNISSNISDTEHNLNESKIQYSIPENWLELEPTSIRKANFAISNDEGSAEVTIIVFPGDAGGLTENVKRWRSQINLPSIRDSEIGNLLEPIIISNHEGYFTKLIGEDDSILGGILPFHGSTWFIKIQGTTSCVINETNRFKYFLENFQIEDNFH